MPAEILEHCNTVEECYEFMLAYAAQGHPSDRGSKTGAQIREFLQRAATAIAALAEGYSKVVKDKRLEPAEKYQAFFAVLDRDARDSLAAIDLVLAQLLDRVLEVDPVAVDLDLVLGLEAVGDVDVGDLLAVAHHRLAVRGPTRERLALERVDDRLEIVHRLDLGGVDVAELDEIADSFAPRLMKDPEVLPNLGVEIGGVHEIAHEYGFLVGCASN